MDDRSDKYRGFFAQLICAAARVTDPRLEQAFRKVRRNPSPGQGHGRFRSAAIPMS